MEAAMEHLALYSFPEFSSLNVGARQHYHRIDYRAANRLVGSLAGVIDGDIFISGFSAGFGGAEFSRGRERLDIVMSFVAHCLATLDAKGIRQIVVHAKPLHYSANEPYLQFALLRQGFLLARTDLNFSIDLTRYRNASDYVAALRHAPRRQLKIALAREHRWRAAGDTGDWRRGYDVLAESRRRHSATLSLSFEYISKMRERFTDKVIMYLLEVEERVAAAVLVYAILPQEAQVMYWGDAELNPTTRAEGGAPLAMMNLVAYRMIEQALHAGWRSIDLGPSTSAESINYGNCVFKTTIGAEPGFRATFVRERPATKKESDAD